MTLPYAKVPCAECPWRRDVAPGHFPPERFRALAVCAEDLSPTVFACHMSKEAEPFVCAGFLLQSSNHNISVRLARQRFDVRSPYPLFDNYREMACANGVKPSDPALRNCRDDGRRR